MFFNVTQSMWHRVHVMPEDKTTTILFRTCSAGYSTKFILCMLDVSFRLHSLSHVQHSLNKSLDFASLACQQVSLSYAVVSESTPLSSIVFSPETSICVPGCKFLRVTHGLFIPLVYLFLFWIELTFTNNCRLYTGMCFPNGSCVLFKINHEMFVAALLWKNFLFSLRQMWIYIFIAQTWDKIRLPFPGQANWHPFIGIQRARSHPHSSNTWSKLTCMSLDITLMLPPT